MIQIQVKTLTLTTNANANGVGYSVIRERGGAESERANTKTRKTIKQECGKRTYKVKKYKCKENRPIRMW